MVEGVDRDPTPALICKINGTQLHMFIGCGESSWDYIDSVCVIEFMGANGFEYLDGMFKVDYYFFFHGMEVENFWVHTMMPGCDWIWICFVCKLSIILIYKGMELTWTSSTLQPYISIYVHDMYMYIMCGIYIFGLERKNSGEKLIFFVYWV